DLWHERGDDLQTLSALNPSLIASRPEVAGLRDAITARIDGASIFRVKIYDQHGHTIFSTDPAQIGEDKGDDDGVVSALSGVVASEFADRDEFSAFEKTTADRDLLSSYVPVYRNGPGSEIIGVFEIYDDVTLFMKDINRTLAWQAVIAIVLSGAVYGVLLWIV